MKHLTLFLLLLVSVLVFAPIFSFGAASVAVVTDATQAVATITTDATAANGYISGGTVTIYSGAVNYATGIVGALAVTLVPNATPAIAPGTPSYSPSNATSYDNVRLELCGLASSSSTFQEAIPIQTITKFKDPVKVDVSMYYAVVLKLYYTTHANGDVYKAHMLMLPK